uniref:Glycerophosphocholine phosphodiesterase n=1 Tax=Schistosoma mansoni TaxID=6183 RepID=A0A5K4EU67_SCHMA
MACVKCHPTVSFSVDINFKSLEDVGIYVETSIAEYKRKIVVGVTGSLDVLGLWNPEKALFCERQSENTNNTETWHCCLLLQSLSAFQYRFFLAELIEKIDENAVSQNLKILAWESRLKPREFNPTDHLNTDKDTEIHMEFGVFENGNFVQRGWLTSNSEIHIRMSSTSCKFFKNNVFTPHTQLFVACSRYVLQPMPIDDEDNETRVTPNKPECSQKEDTLTCLTGSSTPKLSCPQYPFSSRTSYSSVVSRSYPVPMSTLEINRCRIHRGEQPECCGTLYKLGDDVTFFIETSDVENTSVEIQFYQQHLESPGNDTKISSPNPLKFIGSARFGPFVDTYGRKAAQILNSSLSPVGDLRVRYLIIYPMIKPPDPSLKVTYQHHWKKRASAVDIGHRGMGTSFFQPEEKQYKKLPTTRENTLDSFRTAVQHGADFVEMDVQLTKDHHVVVYHDFDAVVISKKVSGQLCYLRVATKDLNYNELRELNVRHSSVLKESHTHEKMNEEDLDPVELQPFPLLHSCFEEIDPDLGFVIEVKYPMELKDGSSEMDHFFEYNFYVDTILREILTHAGKRRILLSCFDPNVCVMLQLKQQIYPVFQLGISPEYADTRHADFQSLFWSALSHQLLGVCLESDRLLKVPGIIELAHSHKLVVLAWGEAVNIPEKRILLAQSGVDGIIYDCVNENKAKGTLSVFKRERFLELGLSSASTPSSPTESTKLLPCLSSLSLISSIDNNDNINNIKFNNNNDDLDRNTSTSQSNLALDQQCNTTDQLILSTQPTTDKLSTIVTDCHTNICCSSTPSTSMTSDGTGNNNNNNSSIVSSVNVESNEHVVSLLENCTNSTLQTTSISTIQLDNNDSIHNKFSSSTSDTSSQQETTSPKRQINVPLITFA